MARQEDCEKGHCCRCSISYLRTSPRSHRNNMSYNRAAVIVQIQSGGLEPEHTSRSALHAATSSRSCNTPINHKQRHSVAANVPNFLSPWASATHSRSQCPYAVFSIPRRSPRICAWRHAGGLQPMRMKRGSTSAEVCPSTERALDQSSQPSHHSCG